MVGPDGTVRSLVKSREEDRNRRGAQQGCSEGSESRAQGVGVFSR